MSPPGSATATSPATDGAPAGPDARTRLLHAAIHLFAEQGYAKTSTRELAEAAQVNVAAISYYFGDKAGLYRAAFLEPMDVEAELARFSDPALSLGQALVAFYQGFLEPLHQGDEARLCMKLHLREMLESTGVLERGLAQSIEPQHRGLVALLARHFGGPEPVPGSDLELERLAICIAALGVHLHVGMDINEQLMPGITSAPGAIQAWGQTLVRLALAMVQAEAQRRGLTLSES
jgi:TetR/AcrR family transcriptional regulator, regulator of cefoperazone and chloramphenicol sensitivity